MFYVCVTWRGYNFLFIVQPCVVKWRLMNLDTLINVLTFHHVSILTYIYFTITLTITECPQTAFLLLSKGATETAVRSPTGMPLVVSIESSVPGRSGTVIIHSFYSLARCPLVSAAPHFPYPIYALCSRVLTTDPLFCEWLRAKNWNTVLSAFHGKVFIFSAHNRGNRKIV